MATLTVAAQLTLLELANRHANAEVVRVVEVLSQKNKILQDAIWEQANGVGGHQITRRVSEPTGTWRMANAGVASEASVTRPITEPVGTLEAFSKVDDYIMRLAKNKDKFRWEEDRAFVNGLNKEIAKAIIYADIATDPEKFDGLDIRFNGLSDTNVLGTGGTGSDLMSIWLVKWDTVEGASLIYPSNSETGLDMEDLGYTITQDGSSNDYMAWVTHLMVMMGLCIRDDRSVYRIANIESTGASNIFDDHDIIDALNTIPDLDNVVIYVNRTAKAQMDKDATDKSNAFYTSADVWGKPTIHFQGIPVKLVEQLLITETALT